LATNIATKAEKRVAELVKKCYFGNRLNKAAINLFNNQEIENKYESK
jgi:hypothetical protein